MNVTHVFGGANEAAVDKVAKVCGVAFGQFGRRRARYLEEDSHRVNVGVGGNTLGQLDGRYAKGPDICLWGREAKQERRLLTGHGHISRSITRVRNLKGNTNSLTAFKIFTGWLNL